MMKSLCRVVVVLLLSIGASADEAKSAFGFTRTKREGDDAEAINRLFAPEFRNRLDAIVAFGHLPREVIAKVVDKFIMQLEAQLADRNVSIELADEAREWLMDNGYDESMGARPMARTIQQRIADEHGLGGIRTCRLQCFRIRGALRSGVERGAPAG